MEIISVAAARKSVYNYTVFSWQRFVTWRGNKPAAAVKSFVTSYLYSSEYTTPRAITSYVILGVVRLVSAFISYSLERLFFFRLILWRHLLYASLFLSRELSE